MQPRDKFFSALLAIRSAGSPATDGTETVGVVNAAGTLDADEMEALRSKVLSCAQRGVWSYMVDLSRVRSMDSPALGMLVSALRTIRDMGGNVGLVTDSASLHRILELCARDRGCRIFARKSDALAALSAGALPKSAA